MRSFIDFWLLFAWTVLVPLPDSCVGLVGTRTNQSDGPLKHTKYRSISTRKCDEYSRSLSQTMWILPLMASKPIPVSIDCQSPINPLVSGSEIVQPDEFPHVVAIAWLLENGNIGYYCGGALISHRWVVTAAHCTHGPFGNPMFVRLGTNRLSDPKSGELVRIKRIKRHPAYDPPSMYADLAMVKLGRWLTFGETIRPACLDTIFNAAPSQVWIAGWGSAKFVDELSDILVKAKLDIIDNVRCSVLYNLTNSAPDGIVPSMLCAGDPNGGWKKDACQGDSGSPLHSVIPNVGCLYELIAVTSFGMLCATSGKPGVYTRISHYVDWIESVVWPDEQSSPR